MAKDSFDEMIREEQRMAEMRKSQIDGTQGKKVTVNFNKIKKIGVILIIVGVVLVLMPSVKRIIMQKKCSERVMATCVSLDRNVTTEDGQTSTTYAPKWEYSFNGRVYHHQEKLYTNIGVPDVGKEYEIFINPDDPEQIYRKDLATSVSGFVFGGVFIFMGVTALVQLKRNPS